MFVVFLLLQIQSSIIKAKQFMFQISAEEVVRTESPISQLAALELPDCPLDLLLCAGHGKALNVYRHNKVR